MNNQTCPTSVEAQTLKSTRAHICLYISTLLTDNSNASPLMRTILHQLHTSKKEQIRNSILLFGMTQMYTHIKTLPMHFLSHYDCLSCFTTRMQGEYTFALSLH